MKNLSKIAPTFQRFWIVCPACKKKFCIADSSSQCRGVFVKCTRGCGATFEIKIADGKQIT